MSQQVKELRKLKKLRRNSSALSDEEEYQLIKQNSLFCQLNELYTNKRKELVWKEKARSLKFIEFVEDSGRWSKPCVATLSLYSLIELRKLIANGVILLDVKTKGFHSLIDDLTNALQNENLLSEKNKQKFIETLLLPNFHQYQAEFSKQLDIGEKHKLKCSKSAANGEQNPDESEHEAEIDEENEDLECEESDESASIDFDLDLDLESRKKRNKSFLEKIPIGTRTANILIGEVDFLDEELMCLVRLQKPLILGKLSEIPISTKFLFILLGPRNNMIKYRQIGKSVLTLFSDGLFQSNVYEANDKKDILTAIDDFLEQSTILPPGQWDTSTRLAPPDKVPSIQERLILKIIKVKKDKPHIGGHEDDSTLQPSKILCQGLIDDVKRKLPWYFSDFRDALNFQCIPTIAFLYFACLAPIITFGGILGYATDQNMGTIESLISGLICGVAYSLFAGQPMTILGSTGPVLVFEKIINSFSKQYGIDYIGFRVWVGLWIAVILLIVVFTNMSYLVKYITRFTEELFAILIAIIFIIESVDKLLKIRQTHSYTTNPFLYVNDFQLENNTRCFRCRHKNTTQDPREYILNDTIYTERKCEELGSDYEFVRDCKNIPDVFFFCVILYIATFLLAISLRKIKFTNFFPTWVRTLVSNFSVIITIVTMVTVDYIVGLDTPKLHVPSEFHPTIPDRGWFINPFERNKGKWWLIFVAIPPAFLASILIFMDQHITAVIVNRKTNKLQKSCGYHLDLLIVSICIGINSLYGLPWFVAATVLSMNHVIALRKVSSSSVPGESAKLVGVIEQRVTAFVVFVLIGCSIFVTHFLTLVPMAVLYAIFMYMGVTPMSELEFFQRILLLFMPRKSQPDLVFLRHVRLFRVHLFTLIQLVCLITLFLLKLNKTISISFPLMVLSLVFIRFAMNYIFTEKELSFLDDLIPGTSLHKKKKLALNEIDQNVFEKARRSRRRSFSKNLNNITLENSEKMEDEQSTALGKLVEKKS